MATPPTPATASLDTSLSHPARDMPTADPADGAASLGYRGPSLRKTGTGSHRPLLKAGNPISAIRVTLDFGQQQLTSALIPTRTL